jgi:hypothetical protein
MGLIQRVGTYDLKAKKLYIKTLYEEENVTLVFTGEI